METHMKLRNLFARFRKDEDGAVTVDWVVLTAGIVAIAIALFAALREPITGLAERIATEIEAVEPQ
jgi:Flp pilus assembly pilin Flp